MAQTSFPPPSHPLAKKHAVRVPAGVGVNLSGAQSFHYPPDRERFLFGFRNLSEKWFGCKKRTRSTSDARETRVTTYCMPCWLSADGAKSDIYSMRYRAPCGITDPGKSTNSIFLTSSSVGPRSVTNEYLRLPVVCQDILRSFLSAASTRGRTPDCRVATVGVL